MTDKVTVRAHTNIALIKYWGKKNEQLIIPMNSSLSLTLDAFYTETSATFDSNLKDDLFYLNGEEQSGMVLDRLKPILDEVRELAGTDAGAVIKSTNNFPTAAGLASSASGMAALAGSASLAAGLQLSLSDLSRLARRGSGSACRSIYGGFVEWQKGNSDLTSMALPVREANFDIGMVFLLLNKGQKNVSSRDGMKRTVKTSPYFDEWVRTTEKDLMSMKQALYEEDFETMGRLTESSAMKMHATTLGAEPPFTYWEPLTLEAIQFVQQLRSEGFSCYFTMDAGPNVKILCRLSQAKEIQQRAAEKFGLDNCIISKPGSGISVVDPKSQELIPYREWRNKEDLND